MAIATYSDLKTAITTWMARAELSGEAADFITLAEARLNRELRGLDVDAALTGVIGSSDLDCTAISINEPVTLFLVDTAGDVELVQRSKGTMPIASANARPSEWAMNGSNISLNAPCDEAYTFRLVYAPRFSLSDSQPTNWLLDEHPDIYLAASILWGHGYVQNFPQAAIWQSVLEQGIPSIRHHNAKDRRGILKTDPGLISRPPYFDGTRA